MDKQNGIDRLKEDIFDYVKTAYETGYEDGNYDNEPFSDGMSCDVHDAISKIVDEFFFEGAGNTSEAVKSLWALYDKYEDAEHVVCGDAAKLLQTASKNKQNWLPVSEPPETETPVFICATRKLCDGGEAQIRSLAMYEDGKTTTDNSAFDWNNENFEYDEKSDSFIIPAGWWEYPVYLESFSAVDDFVTHWMPLPAPPNTRKPEGSA